MLPSISTIAEEYEYLKQYQLISQEWQASPNSPPARELDPHKVGHAADARNGNEEEKIL